MSGIINVHVNCASAAEARTIADEAIGRRLASASNIHAPIDSAFRWNGILERRRETPLVLRTAARRFDDLASLVRELHSYETPSIFAIEIDFLDAAYKEWVISETTPD